MVSRGARETKFPLRNVAFLVASFCEPLQERPPKREFLETRKADFMFFKPTCTFPKSRGKRQKSSFRFGVDFSHFYMVSRGARETKLPSRNVAFLVATFCEPLQAVLPKREFLETRKADFMVFKPTCAFPKTHGKRPKSLSDLE